MRKFTRVFVFCAALAVSILANAVQVGLHMGSDGTVSQYENFSRWLGKPVQYRLTFLDGSSWDTIADPYFLSTATRTWLRSRYDRLEVISVPMMPYWGNQEVLRGIASGAYDSYYKELARNMASKTGAPQRVIVRLGWELNGQWYPWSAVNHASDYKAAYRHIVHTMRSQCSVLRFEWNVNWGGTFDWTTAYPGDDVVDVVGMDVYDQYNSGWDNLLNAYEGLVFFRAFARKHGKPEAYTEWGLSTSRYGHGDDTAYIKDMYGWIRTGGSSVLYANYWNSASGGPDGVIYSDTSAYRVTVPNSAALYRSLFGN